MKDLSKKEKLNEVKTNAAQIILGKNGLSENLLNEIKKKLKQEKIIKIKILKTAAELEKMNRKEFAELIATQTDARLVEIRGYNLILQKKSSA